jgi:hypothetical protein
MTADYFALKRDDFGKFKERLLYPSPFLRQQNISLQTASTILFQPYEHIFISAFIFDPRRKVPTLAGLLM